MTAIVIAGEVIPVNVDVAEDINMAMSRADFVLNLETVGYSVERAQEKADVLIEEGYGRARAWATVDRGDLIALGIGRGFVDGLIDEMRGDFADSVGVPFARACNAGSVVTDEKAVESIKRGKGCPSLPQVSEGSAYLAGAEEWSSTSTAFISWVRSEHSLLGEALQRIWDDPEVDLSTLGVPAAGVVSKALGTLMKTKVFGLLEGHSRRLDDDVLMQGCALGMFQELCQQYSSVAARETLLQAWRAPAPVVKLHLVGVGLTEWGNTRKRLVAGGERLASDEKTVCESIVGLLSGHALTRKIVAAMRLQHGRGLTSSHVLSRMLCDTEYWEQEWAQGKAEPQEAAVAALEEAAVVQAEAFVAGGLDKKGASTDAKGGQRGSQKGEKGGDHVRGWQGYGHCIAHQFFAGGCKDKASCRYWHMPNQEGRFVSVKCPKTGKAPCPMFAKTGKCEKKDCELAHMEVEGAKPKNYIPRFKGQRRVRVRVHNPIETLPTVNVVDDPDPDVSDEGDKSVLEGYVMGDTSDVGVYDERNDDGVMRTDENHENLKSEFLEKSGVKIKSILGTDGRVDESVDDPDPEIENLVNEYGWLNTNPWLVVHPDSGRRSGCA